MLKGSDGWGRYFTSHGLHFFLSRHWWAERWAKLVSLPDTSLSRQLSASMIMLQGQKREIPVLWYLGPGNEGLLLSSWEMCLFIFLQAFSSFPWKTLSFSCAFSK